jgi:hypothetical protein
MAGEFLLLLDGATVLEGNRRLLWLLSLSRWRLLRLR